MAHLHKVTSVKDFISSLLVFSACRDFKILAKEDLRDLVEKQAVQCIGNLFPLL